MQTVQDVHLDMILSAIGYFESNNHTQIKADHVGYPYVYPSEISGQIPDITSFKFSTFYVTEVEDKEGIGTPETIEQWSAFSRFCQQANRQFCVVVPKSCYDEAVESARTNGITVNLWLTNRKY